jgi:branched-chain amino acid transport system permease protein
MEQVLVNSLIVGSVYSLIALGFNFIYGPTKFFNLAHGAVVLIGGYIFLAVVRGLAIHPALAILLAVLCTGALGYVLDRFVYRPLRHRDASSRVLLVTSLGLLTLLQAVIALVFGRQFESFPVYALFGRVFTWGTVTITSFQLLLIVVSLAVGLATASFLYRTLFGKVVRAISNDLEVAKMMGVNTDRTIGVVFFIGSAVAGLAGIMVGFDIGLGPALGLSLLLKGIIASIIGGLGNIYGGILGAYLLAIVENLVVWQFSGEWRDIGAFGLLILFLVIRPYGLFTSPQDRH